MTGTWLAAAALAGVVSAGVACTDRAMDDTKRASDAAADAAKSGADKALDATKQVGAEVLDATKDAAATTADHAKDAASAAGEAATDTWITAKLKTKFADEKVLDGSDISVETNDHLVTLRGTVASGAAKDRAAEIARGTEGVVRVVNEIVVK